MRFRTWVVATCCLVGSLASVAAGATRDLRLAQAVKDQDVAAVRALLKEKVDVNAPQLDGATPIHWAAHWGDLDTATLLIGAGARVNVTDDLGITPLSQACLSGNAALVEALLKAGAHPNTALSTGETPIMMAARVGRVEMVQALKAHGADVNATENTKGQTALMWAAAEGHATVVKTLIDLGADVHARAWSGYTPLLFAARIGSEDTAKVLLAAGVDIEAADDDDGLTPLIVATLRGYPKLALYFLDHGANVNNATAGYTALHWAVGQWDSLLTGPFGITAEHTPWSNSGGIRGAAKIDFVKALLARGADPNITIKLNPPRWGGESGGRSAAGGGGMNLINGNAFTVAAAAWDAPTMRLLLAAGANPNVPTKDHTTPLMLASGLNNEPGRGRWTESAALEATKLLVEELHADLNAVNDAGNMVAHAVAIRGADTLMQYIYDRGAKIDVKNKQGNSPFMIANAQGPRVGGSTPNFPSTRELLRKLGADTSMEHDAAKPDIRPMRNRNQVMDPKKPAAEPTPNPEK